jgi:hypothetical protein
MKTLKAREPSCRKGTDFQVSPYGQYSGLRWLFTAASMGFLLGTGLIAGGCATLIRGTTQNVSVTSSPSHAQVILEGKVIGATPFQQEIPRAGNALIWLAHPETEPTPYTWSTQVEPTFWGNILTGTFLAITLNPIGSLAGLLGFGVDLITGSAYRYSPDQAEIVLTPKATATQPQG